MKPPKKRILKVKCPTHGQLELETSDVRVTYTLGKKNGTYSYVCAPCGKMYTNPATETFLLKLAIYGVKLDDTITP